MPLTFAHPIAVIPLAKRGLPLSALVVGSMIPDLPYFLFLSNGSEFTHNFAAIFYFCIPAGLCALWLFHTLLKWPLLALIPLSHQERLFPIASQFSIASPQQFLLVIVSLVLGATTHIVWDSFTHYGGWVQQRLPILWWSPIYTAQGPIYLFNLLQYVSTFVGMALLIWCYARWYRKAPSFTIQLPLELSTSTKRSLWIGIIVTAFLSGLLYSFSITLQWPQPGQIQPFVRNIVIASVQTALAEILIYSLVWHWKIRFYLRRNAEKA